MSASDPIPPIAVTMGEPSGVVGEIVFGAWEALRTSGPPFALLADPGWLTALAERLGGSHPLAVIADPKDAPAVFPSRLPVLDIGVAVAAEPGRPTSENARAVTSSIELAVRLVRRGACSALVTNPIQKVTLYASGFLRAGHEEYLADLAGVGTTAMMLVADELKVVPVTTHMAVADVPGLLSPELIETAGTLAAEALQRDFDVARPRLAVTGLNPHAGEGGTLGDEEQFVVKPAIDRLRAAGLTVDGPFPADTLFHEAARARYDVALCMYHDQAMIPIKTLAFHRAVNLTLGLPFVRTAPTHGTGIDIAGQGIASPSSLIAAVDLAAELALRRRRTPQPA